MSCDLKNIKLGVSSLSNEIYLYRHGKDSKVALDRRPALLDVMGAVIEYMLQDAPKGAQQEFTFGERTFEITVKPIFK